MQEYWVNVYWYNRHKLGPYLSNSMTKEKAIKYGSKDYNDKRNTLYRIHVKMKKVKGFKRDYPYVWFLDQLYEGDGRAPVAVRPQLSFPLKYEPYRFLVEGFK